MSLGKIKIQKTAQNLIGQIDEKATCEVCEENAVWKINIESDDANMLIGRYGQTLQALEHLLRVMITKEAEEFQPLVVDVSGYRAARQLELENMARNIAKKVLEIGESQDLPPMNAYERRLVHMVLKEIEGIETGSEGVEPYRYIVVRRIENSKTEG